MTETITIKDFFNILEKSSNTDDSISDTHDLTIPDIIEDHPSADLIKNYANGIDVPNNQSLKKHLKNCYSCYNQWVEHIKRDVINNNKNNETNFKDAKVDDFIEVDDYTNADDYYEVDIILPKAAKSKKAIQSYSFTSENRGKYKLFINKQEKFYIIEILTKHKDILGKKVSVRDGSSNLIFQKNISYLGMHSKSLKGLKEIDTSFFSIFVR